MLSELQGRLMENDPPYIPPVISAPGFDARAEERVCINGCLYLRADFAGKMCAPDEQARFHGIAEGMERAAVIADDRKKRAKQAAKLNHNYRDAHLIEADVAGFIAHAIRAAKDTGHAG